MKYFSGTATCTKTVDAPADWFASSARLWLDLGDVKNIAEASVNGRPVGAAWKTPFRVDVTPALKAGANTLEIKVVNLWVSRLIGDQQEGVTPKYTCTAQPFYRADSLLLPSGLIGPVQLVRTAGQQVLRRLRPRRGPRVRRGAHSDGCRQAPRAGPREGATHRRRGFSRRSLSPRPDGPAAGARPAAHEASFAPTP